MGCARDIVREGENGAVFRTDDWGDCVRVMRKMAAEWSKETKRTRDQETKSRSEAKTARVPPSQGEGKPKDGEPNVESKREAIRAGAWEFDTARGVEVLVAGLGKVGR